MISTGDGLNLFIQLIGSAADTILVPNRIYMFEDFQRLASDHTVIFYDPRNRGLSDTVIDPSKLTRGIHHDVEDIEAIRQHFGIDRLAILAHSYSASRRYCSQWRIPLRSAGWSSSARRRPTHRPNTQPTYGAPTVPSKIFPLVSPSFKNAVRKWVPTSFATRVGLCFECCTSPSRKRRTASTGPLAGCPTRSTSCIP